MFRHPIANVENSACIIFLERLCRGIVFAVLHFTCDLHLLAQEVSRRAFQWPGFTLEQVCVRFMLDEVELEQTFLRVLRGFVLRMILPIFQTY
jgi:hypothetical protein